MSEQSPRELYDIINEMRVDIGVVKTKMDFVLDTKKTAERAELKADKAQQKSSDLEDEIASVEDRLDKKIDGIKKTAMWAIGLTVTSIIGIGGLIIAVFG